MKNALSSVAEVAIFAWSLLELLLTRILPLAVCLAGHLLLEFGSLLTSVFIPAAGQWKPRAEYFWDVLQAEALTEEDKVQDVVREDAADHHQNNSESLKSIDKLEESQRISREEGSILSSLTHEVYAQPADQGHGAASNESNEAQLRGRDNGHVAESSPSDVRRSDVDHRLVAEAQPSNLHITEGHVSSKAEGSARKMDLEPSDVQRSEEGTNPSTEVEGEMRKSSRRRMRVLPPSLSQVKRTLMQRSRRASPSPRTSPAILAPSPSPIQKKPRGSRRSASSAIRASPSYDNFVRKFRKHFLLSPA